MRTMKKDRLAYFEALAQRLVEDTFRQLFGEQSIWREVAAALAQAVEDGARQTENELAPTHYRLFLHREDFARVEDEWNDLAPRLATYIIDVAEQAGLYLSAPPVVELALNESTHSAAVYVQTRYATPLAGTTQTYTAVDSDVRERLQALDAFLIVDGRRHVRLDKALVTIGRRVDNDVIIDSPVVSRQHAHVRWRQGRFVLYDVGSRSGVAVNGEPCQEWVLRPGDLITLANRVSIIYGEGIENRDNLPSSSTSRKQETLSFPVHEEGQ